MHRIVNDEALDTLFRAARSHHAWLARPVSDTLLRAVWELVKLGPTSSAGRPARILFIRSEVAKERLAPAVPAAHWAAIRHAPVAAIVGHEPDHGPGQDRRQDRRAAAGREGERQAAHLQAAHLQAAHLQAAHLQAAHLQAAYLIVAARALGLDCGPIWDFDARAVDAAFFPEGSCTASFLCALGYGDDTQLLPEEARPAFDEAYRIL
jgi:3-hydroxypropanoate dehydrogenase